MANKKLARNGKKAIMPAIKKSTKKKVTVTKKRTSAKAPRQKTAALPAMPALPALPALPLLPDLGPIVDTLRNTIEAAEKLILLAMQLTSDAAQSHAMSSEAVPATLVSRQPQGLLTVRRQFRKNGEDTSSEENDTPLEVQTFEVEPAKVYAEMGLTLNLGNYESARVLVGVGLPCYAEEVDAALAAAKLLAEAAVEKEVNEIRAAKGQNGDSATDKPGELF